LFWREFSKILAQWFGVGLSSILAGVTLGILLQNGVGQKEARGIALSLGFVLALAFWVMIGRLFVFHPIECAKGLSSTVVQFEANASAFPAPAYAAAIVIISLYTFQQPLTLHGAPTVTTINYHACPKI
jgi:hypothetical protein